jgi:hypothetical protein
MIATLSGINAPPRGSQNRPAGSPSTRFTELCKPTAFPRCHLIHLREPWRVPDGFRCPGQYARERLSRLFIQGWSRLTSKPKTALQTFSDRAIQTCHQDVFSMMILFNLFIASTNTKHRYIPSDDDSCGSGPPKKSQESQHHLKFDSQRSVYE